MKEEWFPFSDCSTPKTPPHDSLRNRREDTHVSLDRELVLDSQSLSRVRRAYSVPVGPFPVSEGPLKGQGAGSLDGHSLARQAIRAKRLAVQANESPPNCLVAKLVRIAGPAHRNELEPASSCSSVASN